MATAASSHAASQATLATAMADPLNAAWSSLLNPDDLEATLPQYVAGVQAVVQQYGRAAAAVAAQYYATQRAEAGVRGTFTVRPASAAPADVIDAGLKWATKGLWTPKPDIQAVQTNVAGTAERYALDAGRDTLISAVKADRKAIGWARVVEPGACSFCLLLATRGAVYRSDKTADFRSHDHCRCHVEPVFVAYEPTAEIRRAQAIYSDVKRTARGPAAVRRAFRQAIEADRPT